MSWPRFRLTPEEAQYSQKYDDPTRGLQPVLRRFYPGELNVTPEIRQDSETIQIARRSRIFAFTASGDINLMELQIIDSSGEQYTSDFIPISQLLCGSNWDPRSVGFFTTNFATAVGQFPGNVKNFAGYFSPHVFEPSIVLAPNQTLSFNARMINFDLAGPIHVDFNLHVWEFPGAFGSPL